MTQPAQDGLDLDAVARSQFGLQRLTDEQRAAMWAVLHGRDLLAVLPTGSEKSAIYEVPSLLTDGVTLVVSPLNALQEDQISAIECCGAGTAVAINSGLRHARLSLIVVDEAHCVSAWAHDFRPDYRRLADVFRRLGESIPVVALTAAASVVVRRDIVDRLELHDPAIVVGSFDRPNLHLSVERHVDGGDKRRAVLDMLPGLPGPGLVYVATRKDAEFFAESLRAKGLTAAAYHAGMTAAGRDAVHAGFRDDEYELVVATSAFGMGIDKPNVRFVVHATVPDSLDSYYQQIGRAGRDGQDALALLFYSPEDFGLERVFTTGRPDKRLLRAVHNALGASRPAKATELRRRLGIRGRRLTDAINLLDESGVVRSTRGGFLRTEIAADAAVAKALRTVELRERVDRSRIEMMRGYAETGCCRRVFLLSYFGQQPAGACVDCDRCIQAAQRDDVSVDEPALPVDTAVRHREWGPGVVIGGDRERITVLFEEFGYRTLSMAAVHERGLLDVTDQVVEPDYAGIPRKWTNPMLHC